MDELKYQTGFKRFGAAIIDSIVFMPFSVADHLLSNSSNSLLIIILWQFFFVSSPIIYSVVSHYKYGQTIGKWVTGVKVLDISETRKINFKQSLLRDSFYLLIESVGFFIFISSLYQQHSNPYEGFMYTPGLVWTGLELVTMLTNYKRRAIHDYLAKSVVIRTYTNVPAVSPAGDTA